MDSYYLNSYAPLIINRRGSQISSSSDIPPFVDGSIRREPDLEHEQPAITCLCRGKQFTPRLEIGDHIAYLTKKVRFDTRTPRQRRLTAVLRVKELFANHEAAAEWYLQHNRSLPNNIVVDGNAAKLLKESHCKFQRVLLGVDDNSGRSRWDNTYRKRAKRFPVVAVCDRLFVDIQESAPIISDDMLANAFGKIPGTQNPGRLAKAAFMKLLRLACIKLPSSP